MNQRVIFTLCSLATSLLMSAEPSAFGAGDLTNSNPYGLTSNEKVILQTKKTLHKVAVKSNNQANKLDSLRDRIDGFQTIIESLSRKAHNNKIILQKILQSTQDSELNTQEYNQRVSDFIQNNQNSIKKQELIITELSQVIDTINTQYVAKSEFNTLVNEVNTLKLRILKELKKFSKNIKVSAIKSAKSSANIYNQAKKYFDKKYYTDAIKNYELLIKRNYKPAYAHYMIGEMNFKRKNYANAISYFKKSASLYSKASYMPTLMLHSAISMKNTGDGAHANNFLEAIIVKYPNSLEAKEAKKYFQK